MKIMLCVLVLLHICGVVSAKGGFHRGGFHISSSFHGTNSHVSSGSRVAEGNPGSENLGIPSSVKISRSQPKSSKEGEEPEITRQPNAFSWRNVMYWGPRIYHGNGSSPIHQESNSFIDQISGFFREITGKIIASIRSFFQVINQ